MAKIKVLDSGDEYSVGWISALAIERAAATAMLDEEHAQPRNFEQASMDSNSYAWGSISGHNVVIASLPAGVYGNTPATAAAMHMLASLPRIKFGLMVGIGAGLPSKSPRHSARRHCSQSAGRQMRRGHPIRTQEKHEWRKRRTQRAPQ